MQPDGAPATPPKGPPTATGDQRSFPLGLGDVGQAPTQFVAQHLEELMIGKANEAHGVIAATDQDPILGPDKQPALPSTTIIKRSGVAGKIVTGSRSLNTRAREAREWGAIGVSCSTGQSGVITGPPELRA